MSDLKRITPLVEYLEILYTRLALEMPNHPEISRWWVELHPPSRFTEEQRTGSVGYIKIKAISEDLHRSYTYRAHMEAVQKGAECSVEVLTQVADMHIYNLFKTLRNDNG